MTITKQSVPGSVCPAILLSTAGSCITKKVTCRATGYYCMCGIWKTLRYCKRFSDKEIIGQFACHIQCKVNANLNVLMRKLVAV